MSSSISFAHAALVLWCLAVAGVFASGDEAADQAERLARETLGRQLGTSVDGAVTVEVAAVEWSDSSLGCPRPATTYAQMLTSGHRVVLRIGGSDYTVHVGAGRAVVCGSPREVAQTRKPVAGPARAGRPPESEAAIGLRLANEARRRLAARLKIAPSRISTDFYRPTTWPDAGLGCASPGVVRPAQPVRGFLIQLTVGGEVHEFHSDHTRVVECRSAPPGRPGA